MYDPANARPPIDTITIFRRRADFGFVTIKYVLFSTYIIHRHIRWKRYTGNGIPKMPSIVYFGFQKGIVHDPAPWSSPKCVEHPQIPQ